MRAELVPLSFHLLLPAIACLLGVLTVHDPALVLMVTVAGGVFAWVWVMRALVGSHHLHASGAASALLCAIGAYYGYATGMLIGHDGTAPFEAWLVAFAAGLAAGILARQRSRYIARLEKAIREAHTQDLPSLAGGPVRESQLS
jgi:hypothetical protein